MMILNENKCLVMELPWETVELIMREALKDDINLCNDPDLMDALERVYEYYGGNLE